MGTLITIALISVLGYFVYLSHGWELAVSITYIMLGLVGIHLSQQTSEERLASLRAKFDKEVEAHKRQLDSLYEKLDSLSSQVSRIETPPTNYHQYDYDD